jgi:hypothetical protein
LGWSGDPQGRTQQVDLMRSLVMLRKSVMFLHYHPERGFGQKKIINVWWRGRGGNADLMLLLVHLIRQHWVWEDAQIRLLRIIANEEGVEDTRRSMEKLLEKVRVKAEPVVLVRTHPTQLPLEIITQWSQDADFTLIGMQFPEANKAKEYGDRLHHLVEAVGSALLVRSGQIEGDLLEAG